MREHLTQVGFTLTRGEVFFPASSWVFPASNMGLFANQACDMPCLPHSCSLEHALADGRPVPASMETRSPLSSQGLFSPWVDPGPPKLKWNISRA